MKGFAGFVKTYRAGIAAAAVLGCLLALPPAAGSAARQGIGVTPLEDDFGGGTAPGYESLPTDPSQTAPGQTAPENGAPGQTVPGSPDGYGAPPSSAGQPPYKDGMVMAYLVELMRKQNRPCPSGVTPPAPPPLVFSEPLCRVAEAVGNGSDFPSAYEAQGIYASHWRMFSAPDQPAQQVATRLRAQHCEALLEPHTHIGAWLGPQGWRIVLATLVAKPDPGSALAPAEGSEPALPVPANDAHSGQGAAPPPVSTLATAPAAVAGFLAAQGPPATAASDPAKTPGAEAQPAAAPVTPSVSGTQTPTGAAPDGIPRQEARAMFQRINDLRAKGGSCLGKAMKPAPPLAFDSILQAAAEKDAAGAAARGGFSAAAGSPSGTIQGTETYPGAKVAKLYGISSPPPAAMLDVWLVSPPRCETLLSPDYDDIGVAYDGRYWVVMMGQRARGVPSPEIPASQQGRAVMP